MAGLRWSPSWSSRRSSATAISAVTRRSSSLPSGTGAATRTGATASSSSPTRQSPAAPCATRSCAERTRATRRFWSSRPPSTRGFATGRPTRTRRGPQRRSGWTSPSPLSPRTASTHAARLETTTRSRRSRIRSGCSRPTRSWSPPTHPGARTGWSTASSSARASASTSRSRTSSSTSKPRPRQAERLAQLVREDVHEKAVVEGPVGTALVQAHDPDRLETHGLVGPNRAGVRRGRVDHEPVVATLLEEMACEESQGLAAQALVLALGGEEEVHPRVPIVRRVLLVVADDTDEHAVGFDREARHLGIGNELVGRFLRRPGSEPPGHLGLPQDLDDAPAVAVLERPEGHALPAERRRHGVIEVPVAPAAPVAPVAPPASCGGTPAIEAT